MPGSSCYCVLQQCFALVGQEHLGWPMREDAPAARSNAAVVIYWRDCRWTTVH